jgi:hypothetical protein
MDTLGAFLKTALYRVIFVLIVGIPAVELFSYAFFGDSFAIHIISDYSNETLTGKIKLNLDHINVNNSSSVPGKATIDSTKLGHSDKNYSGVQIEIPTADIS